MRGHRVVISKKFRSQILEELHEGHFGIVKMQDLARNYEWWPRIDKDLEALTKNCRNCNSLRKPEKS